MPHNIILGIYLALLIVGGFIGYLKAGSKISLIASVVSAVLLGLAQAYSPASHWVEGILAMLLVLFGVRFAKGKKFMPAGLMVVLTLAALISRFVP